MFGRKSVPGVVVGQDVDAQALAQELAPGVDVAKVLRVGVRVEDGDGGVGIPARRRRRPAAVSRPPPCRRHLLRRPAVRLVAPPGLDGLDIAGGYSGPPGRAQPYDLGLLQLGRGRWLEQEGRYRVPHGKYSGRFGSGRDRGLSPLVSGPLCLSLTSLGPSRGGFWRLPVGPNKTSAGRGQKRGRCCRGGDCELRGVDGNGPIGTD